jgi:CubicO group peptidase (beta-lactamase class C family)
MNSICHSFWTPAKAFSSCVLALVLASAGARAAETSKPEDLGLSSERLQHIDRFYLDQVHQGKMSGIVILIARHGKLAHFKAIGYSDLGTRREMQKNTIFRLYSMTKPIAATALMLLYEEGRFQLDDPISKYLPEFAHIRVLRTPDSPISDTVAAEREPTIHDLFRHTAGLMHGGDPAHNAVDAAYIKAGLFKLDTPLAKMIQELARVPLRYQPGTRFEYSLGQDVQARLVEVLSGMPFDQFLQTRLFAPLGMNDTGYWAKDPARLAAVHWTKEGRIVPCDDSHGYPDPAGLFYMEPANINSYASEHARRGGSYGLTSTAEDYWKFSQMMLNGGQLNGRRILSEETVRFMTRDHLGSIPSGTPGVGWGLGFAVLKDPVAAGIIGSEGSFYWAGAANTTFWVDPKDDIVVVEMTQHLDAQTVDWPTIREQLSAMVYGALIN